MADIVPLSESPNRHRAMELIARSRRSADPAPSRAARETSARSSGATIAATTAAALREAIMSVAPYSSHGATLDAEMEVQHRDEHGAQTVARIKFTYGGAR